MQSVSFDRLKTELLDAITNHRESIGHLMTISALIDELQEVLPPTAVVMGAGARVSHGVDGFMEPVGDIDLQAERLTELLTDTGLHAKMAVAARRTAETRFCTDLLIPRYEAYYKQVISEGTFQPLAVSK